ncbi:hypothetical protein Tco_1064119 [Tanacetum coccineum]
MLRIKILHDVVGTLGYHCGVLQSFPVEIIEQEIRELDGIPVALVARQHKEKIGYEKANMRKLNLERIQGNRLGRLDHGPTEF